MAREIAMSLMTNQIQSFFPFVSNINDKPLKQNDSEYFNLKYKEDIFSEI